MKENLHLRLWRGRSASTRERWGVKMVGEWRSYGEKGRVLGRRLNEDNIRAITSA
jgi:hypothetical protein